MVGSIKVTDRLLNKYLRNNVGLFMLKGQFNKLNESGPKSNNSLRSFCQVSKLTLFTNSLKKICHTNLRFEPGKFFGVMDSNRRHRSLRFLLIRIRSKNCIKVLLQFQKILDKLMLQVRIRLHREKLRSGAERKSSDSAWICNTVVKNKKP